jgi:hypothetical protein
LERFRFNQTPPLFVLRRFDAQLSVLLSLRKVAGGVANLVEIAVASISSGLSLSRHAARSMQ